MIKVISNDEFASKFEFMGDFMCDYEADNSLYVRVVEIYKALCIGSSRNDILIDQWNICFDECEEDGIQYMPEGVVSTIDTIIQDLTDNFCDDFEQDSSSL